MLFAKLKAKLFAASVKDTTQAVIDVYMQQVKMYIEPLPELAGDLAEIVVNNQDEIERTIKLGIKMRDEVTAVLEKHAQRIDGQNEHLNELINKFGKKAEKLMRSIK